MCVEILFLRLCFRPSALSLYRRDNVEVQRAPEQGAHKLTIKVPTKRMQIVHELSDYEKRTFSTEGTIRVR